MTASEANAIKAKEIVKPISLQFRLAELPTAYHRAGLAALILMIRWLDRFVSPVPGILSITDIHGYGATLLLDTDGLRRLMDTVYAATIGEEERPNQKTSGQGKDKTKVPPKRTITKPITDSKTGNVKEQKVFIYDVVIPHGAFLVDHGPQDPDGQAAWLKLWRNMIWGIVRGIPATRGVYEARANKEQSKETDKLWKSLASPDAVPVPLTSSLMLGVQSASSEGVPFTDYAKDSFLLHFWPLVAQTYVPQIIGIEKGTSLLKRKADGYAIAIPDVAHLTNFCDDFIALLDDRSPQRAGYLPATSVIEAPVESALDLMLLLCAQIAKRQGQQDIEDAILGVEIVHARTGDHGPRTVSLTRVDTEPEMIDQYARFKGLRDPFIAKQRLSNLINRNPWHHGFDHLCSTTSEHFTILSRSFRAAARMIFEKEFPMSDTENTSLERIIYNIVGNYLNTKLASKYDLTWSEAKASESVKKEYNQMREKLGREVFLALRQRAKDRFIKYFTGTLCSVPHMVSPEQYQVLSAALYNETDKVKSITMLALSARS